MPIPHLGELAALGTAMLWTLSTLAWTSAGRYIGALPISFIRLLLTLVLVAGYQMLFYGTILPLPADGRTWCLLGISGFMGLFITDVCMFHSFLLIGPRIALLILSLSPPVAAVISWLWLGDWLHWWDWAAMGLTLAGVLWVVYEQPAKSQSLHYLRPEQSGWGVVLACCGAVGNAISLVLSKDGIGHYDAFSATYVRVLGAMGGYLVLISLLRAWPEIWAALCHRKAMKIVAAGSFVGPFLGVAFSMTAIRYAQPGVVAAILATMPVLILPFVVLVYRERVSLRAVLGALLAVVGVIGLVLNNHH
ncbi:MAG: DMT family transporter [Thermoguttaceae bacterium]|nr:DMT family transporter [Thermoguttaceae bacterium]MDW8037835.1 DMT family transporter [Thermoguttaceae bacterium]